MAGSEQTVPAHASVMMLGAYPDLPPPQETSTTGTGMRSVPGFHTCLGNSSLSSSSVMSDFGLYGCFELVSWVGACLKTLFGAPCGGTLVIFVIPFLCWGSIV